jgi:hypothetical protein
MSDVHADAIAHHISGDAVTFASLPLPLAHRIFLTLLVDERGRACCVCRAWRDALAAPALWTRLDMSAVRVEWQRFLPMLHGAELAVSSLSWTSRSSLARPSSGTCCCRC